MLHGEVSADRALMVDVSDLYTKNGRPLQRSGDDLYSRSGRYLGRVRNGKVYDQSGKYAGTIVGDRVVYRGTDGATIGSPSISANRVGDGTCEPGRVGDMGR
jgi:hypothetical protein